MSESQTTYSLKEIYNEGRFRTYAEAAAVAYPEFSKKRFLEIGLTGLQELNLLRRMRRMTEAFHATLPADFKKAVTILKKVAPNVERGFATLVFPDFVREYGLGHFDHSLAALKYFTTFGSSEFGIRPFLRQDLPRALAEMEKWSKDASEDVRRLASEGSRPRLPWSFQIPQLIVDPTPTRAILEALCADPSLYVRKSVANHLNDITKSHPEIALEWLASWPKTDARTTWIVRHALRTLIKRGDRGALGLVGVQGSALIRVERCELAPSRLRLGETFGIDLEILSSSTKPQRLVIDYAIHYIKKGGVVFRKVFKWKVAELGGGAKARWVKKQMIRDFSTRKHHPGRHEVEILINGQCVARTGFDLLK